MDVFSHGLWAGVISKGTNLSSKKPRKINPWLAAFWGVFPDVFAFGISFIWLFASLINGDLDRSQIPDPNNIEPIQRPDSWAFKISAELYNYSHSLVIFLIVIGLVVVIKYFLRKNKNWKELLPWEMFGWLLHIICDVPTHSYKFYPTPVFWPISSWKFNGFSWGVWWFMLLNYRALTLVFLVIYFKKRNLQSSNKNI